jgi:uncharacterized protein (DUF58 family)
VRRLGLVVGAIVLGFLALATEEPTVYFLVYLAILVVGGAYLVARRGLSGLEAGAWLDRQQAAVGDVLTLTYSIRNRSRLPKPWLEVHSPSTLPMPVPGRVVAIAPLTARTWIARVPLTERGQFRIDPMVVRTGDPIGLFESAASVGSGASLLVFPRVQPLPGWRLPPSPLEGNTSRAQRGPHATPLVTGVRPYTTGDAFNRIHWRSSARHQDLQVKEFDVEETADVRIICDLERARHTGSGASATIETVVSAATAIAAHALDEDRNVSLELVGFRRVVVPSDRGDRQRQKILSLLAVSQADGGVSLGELLVEAGAHIRKGTVIVIVTPSLERDWVPLAGHLRSRGTTIVACIVDPAAHATATAELLGPAWVGRPTTGGTGASPSATARDVWAIERALHEHEIETHVLTHGSDLGSQIVTASRMALVTAR